MEYKTLKAIYYQDFPQYEQEYHNRLNTWGTIKTEMYPYLMKKQELETYDFPLFALPTLEIQMLSQQIVENSNLINKLSEDLPTVANEQFYKEQLYKAIIATNEIEGVKTTRKELQAAEEMVKFSNKHHNIKHLSTIRMYRDILSNEFLKISTLEDIRKIYDQLTTGEIAIEDSLDGQLFRSKFVSITNNNDKIEHIAPSTEPAITNMLNSWLTFINNRRFPFLIKASLAHYFFENVHPFYDGNGRTGRYILSKYLSRKLDKFSGLIINKKINENKTSYYKAFSDTGHYLNRADGTMFVHMILKYLIKGQNEIIAVLSDKKAGLSFYQDKIRHLKLTLPQSEVLYLILQSQLFTDNELEVLTQAELLEILKHTEYSQRSIKQALKDLEEADFIYRIYNNPIKYLISKSFFNHN